VGSYLFQRVLQDGKDSRYALLFLYKDEQSLTRHRFDEIKKSPPKFFGAWMAQGTLIITFNWQF
jgi:hypothetical protein